MPSRGTEEEMQSDEEMEARKRKQEDKGDQDMGPSRKEPRQEEVTQCVKEAVIKKIAELEARVDEIDVVEMYSVPRVTVEARKFGLSTGPAMDIRTGWDFDDEGKRKEAMEYIRRVRTWVVIGCPMCKMMSQLQNLSPWTAKRQAELEKDIRHMEFMAEI